MNELCEVHIITDFAHQTQLFGYITNISKKPNLINPRPTCAFALYGDYPIQPMLTFKMFDTLTNIKTKVEEIEEEMQSFGLPILRTKIEAMAHNSSVPLFATNDHYFEFHFKILINNTEEWNRLVHLLTPYGCHLFYNPYNKTLHPIATIRRYDCSLQELEDLFDEVMSLLKEEGFDNITAAEKEYSVYDSNVMMDHNWLFYFNTPRNFITTVNKVMLF